MTRPAYDSVLLFSFGGPEGPEEVMPFLEQVVGGKRVPRERLEAVAEHYHHFGGVSPINGLNRELIAALQPHVSLPIYFGNRNWHPFVEDTLREMKQDGRRRAIAITTSALRSFSGCRAYLDDLAAARAAIGDGAPEIDKLPPFGGHPGYIETCTERLRETLDSHVARKVLFSAHSIPSSMSAGCDYVEDHQRLSRAVAEAAGVSDWQLVYQSRSGPPHIEWLGPDVGDVLRALGSGEKVVVAPFGFVADHMEVVWDLDEEARAIAEAGGIDFRRARTANSHPRFVRMLVELIDDAIRRPPEACTPDCCRRA